MSFAVVETYEMNDKRTVIPMAITTSFALMLLLSLAALYKHLAPVHKCKDSEPAVCRIEFSIPLTNDLGINSARSVIYTATFH